jgi:hypothetical protein
VIVHLAFVIPTWCRMARTPQSKRKHTSRRAPRRFTVVQQRKPANVTSGKSPRKRPKKSKKRAGSDDDEEKGESKAGVHL